MRSVFLSGFAVLACCLAGCTGAVDVPGAPELTAEQFEARVRQSTGLVLVEFGASWCGPCHAQARVLNKVIPDYSDRVAFYRIDIDACPDLSELYEVRSIPALFLFRDGKAFAGKTGVQREAVLRAWLDREGASPGSE